MKLLVPKADHLLCTASSVCRAEALAGCPIPTQGPILTLRTRHLPATHDVSRTFGLNQATSLVNGRLQLKRPASSC